MIREDGYRNNLLWVSAPGTDSVCNHRGEGSSVVGLRPEQVNRRLRIGQVSVKTLPLTVLLLLFSGATAIAQLPGDLDANGEVNLADLVDFVGCLDGPDGITVNPACDSGNFDSDTDIDLRDFAGFQARFGFGQGPPQIVSFTPTPGEWVVDDIGLTEVKIGFSEPVTVPSDAVDVWLVGGGTVTGFALSYNPDTFELTVSFASPLRDDQVTVVVDYTIEDVAGNPLDGEILDPKNAVLPSGNNINGGQGVFRIRVLQGDANRNGVVDATDETIVDDSLNLCDGDPGFDALADLNTDGCVDATDADIVTAALDNILPVTDGAPPMVVRIITAGSSGLIDTLDIVISERVSDALVNRQTCFLVDADGKVSTPLFSSPSLAGDSIEYFFVPAAKCFTVNISNALGDLSGELLEVVGPLECP